MPQFTFLILNWGYVCWFSMREEGGEREREKRRKRERERDIIVRNINWFLPIRSPTRDQTCNLGMCPDWESNPQTFGVWDDAPTNWATWPRYLSLSFNTYNTFGRIFRPCLVSKAYIALFQHLRQFAFYTMLQISEHILYGQSASRYDPWPVVL